MSDNDQAKLEIAEEEDPDIQELQQRLAAMGDRVRESEHDVRDAHARLLEFERMMDEDAEPILYLDEHGREIFVSDEGPIDTIPEVDEEEEEEEEDDEEDSASGQAESKSCEGGEQAEVFIDDNNNPFLRFFFNKYDQYQKQGKN